MSVENKSRVNIGIAVSFEEVPDTQRWAAAINDLFEALKRGALEERTANKLMVKRPKKLILKLEIADTFEESSDE